jgi:hypothetical protein
VERPRDRRSPAAQEPEVRVAWVRAAPTPQQAWAWRELWKKLLAPNDEAGEAALSPSVLQAEGEACDEADCGPNGLQDLSRVR